MMRYHKCALLSEAVEGLNISRNGVYVDVTFGGGSHSREVLRRLGSGGRLIAFDQDKDVLEHTVEDNRFELIIDNFCFIKQHLKFRNISQVDGILADFGVSSHQIDTPSRGFSIRFDALLDMRMNQQMEKNASEIINNYSAKDLKRIFFSYGELRQSDKLAKAIVERRALNPICTTTELKSVVKDVIVGGGWSKLLAKVFQAIRIEVNNELGVIKDLLIQSASLLKTGGRISVISYHSLEDRLVKRFVREGKFEGYADKDLFGNVSVPFKKIGAMIAPSKEEVGSNNRVRSARLRVAEKI